MKFGKSFPFLVLLFVGVSLASLSIYWAKKSTPRGASEAIGQIEAEFGDVWIIDPRGIKKNLIQSESPLAVLETLETSSEGTATLTLKDGHKIRLLENSAIFFEKSDEGLLLHLAQGQFQTEAFGSDRIWVSRQGQRLTLRDYNIENVQLTHSSDFVSPTKNPPEGMSVETDSKETVKSELGLSKEIIQNSISQQRSGFFRCYSSLLQRTPGVTGQVSMKVMIERSGRPTAVDILSTTLREPQFRDCLLEVARRIEFKPFKGDIITTVFPIKFE